MPWIVEKCSAPGWERMFEDEADALRLLREHICGDCMSGTLRIVDTSVPGNLRCEMDGEPPPDPNSIRSLLNTACGCEYDVREVDKELRLVDEYDRPEDENNGTPTRQVAFRYGG